MTQQQKQEEVIDPEFVNQSTGGLTTQELLKQGMAMMRLENETQMQMSIQRPRNEELIIQSSIQELELCPEFARSSYYSIPYKDYKGEGEATTWVEGLSIKAAMALERRWGNCSNGGRIVEETDDRVIVEGVFLDYQTNIRTLRQITISKLAYSKKTKSYYPLRPDRLNMAILAGMSKAIRNAILASLPEGLKEMYFARAKQLVLKGSSQDKVTKAKAIKQLLSDFGEIAVTRDMVVAFLGTDTMTEKDIVRLRGLLTAIQEGQAKVEDYFKKPEAPGNTNQQPTGGSITTGQILGSKQLTMDEEKREPGQDG